MKSIINFYKTQITQLLGDHGITNYHILIDGRLKLTMAFVLLDKRTITINKDLLINPRFFHLIEDTILHEIAHIITYEHCGTLGHNDTWKFVCKVIGATPNAYETDNYFLNEQHKKTYKYMLICDYCEHTQYTNDNIPFYCRCSRKYTRLIKDKKTNYGFTFKLENSK